MSERQQVVIECGALDEAHDGSIVLRGRLALGSLHRIKFDDDYQRPLEDRSDIFEAFKAGKVLPDVVLGCRGYNYIQSGNDFILTEPTYGIDGRQRIGNALRALDVIPDLEIRLGSLVHFGTNSSSEAELFTDLNRRQKKVSPNLHLRNYREQSDALLTLYGLSRNAEFVLHGRVCWDQHMKRGHHLVSAMQLAKASGFLHNGAMSSCSPLILADTLDRIAGRIGLQVFRENVIAFFAAIEQCWGLCGIEYRERAPQLRGTFMFSLASVFYKHDAFWGADKRLRIDSGTIAKLKSFPFRDERISKLASSGGPARHLLYRLMIDHLNRGKRERRLIEREDA